MLNAIIHGKRRGVAPNEATSDSQSLLSFQGAEDLLTASVFERLLYLSEDTFKSILGKLFATADLNPQILTSTRITEVQFWPSLHLKNRDRVEPDCLVEFDDFILIVEAKRKDLPMQYPQQWAREIAAVFNEKGMDKRVYLFAIGGFAESGLNVYRLNAIQHGPIFAEYGIGLRDFHLLPISWTRLWRIIDAIRISMPLSENEKRIVEDIRMALELHEINVAPIAWLKDLFQDVTKLKIDRIKQSSLEFFEEWAIRPNVTHEWHWNIQNAKIMNSALDLFSRSTK